jgi:hypothetical protein
MARNGQKVKYTAAEVQNLQSRTIFIFYQISSIKQAYLGVHLKAKQ